MISFQKALGNVKRIRYITKTFLKYGFGPLIYELNLAPLLNAIMRFITPKQNKEISTLPPAVRFRKLLEDLGTTFIKVGQFLASRPDILNEEFITELKKLQDSVPYLPFDQIKPIIEDSIKKPIETIFLEIDPTPIASASIAQVHRAVLIDGRDVAIKIKRPNIKEIINQDITIMHFFSNIAEKYIQEARQIQLKKIVDELSEQITKELNFELEIFYIKKFKDFFKDNYHLLFPDVIEEYSNNEIIVMNMITGTRIDNIEVLRHKNLNLKEIAKNGVNFYMKQVFEFGFFHADPHPGNLLITDDGKIAVLDFGIIGKVDSMLLEHLSSIFVCLIKLDIDGLVSELIEFKIINEESDIRKIKLDLMDIIMPVYGKNIGDIDSVKMFHDIIKIGRKYRFNFPVDYLYIIKTFAFLESIGKSLDPEFNVLNFAKPYAKKIIKNKYSYRAILKKKIKNLGEYNSIIESFPGDYRRIVNKIIQDKITFNFVHRGLEKFSSQIDKSTNRLSFSIVIAGILLGSSIIVHSNIGPKLFGIPFLGLIGFVISVFFAIGLLIGIIRSGKLW
ncbi:ABC1 kinase family protein [Calditerrivibrio sp.]|uniref:ABC1 kinase family protein n=1 Tax=Calditerrivibrio sp. TaxID=2792612 RepID=UPI003D0F70A4